MKQGWVGWQIEWTLQSFYWASISKMPPIKSALVTTKHRVLRSSHFHLFFQRSLFLSALESKLDQHNFFALYHTSYGLEQCLDCQRNLKINSNCCLNCSIMFVIWLLVIYFRFLDSSHSILQLPWPWPKKAHNCDVRAVLHNVFCWRTNSTQLIVWFWMDV